MSTESRPWRASALPAVTSSSTDDVTDRGASDALALVLLAPAMIGLALLVVFLGRQVDSRAQVRSAAESAAQAAALTRDPESAARVAHRTAAAMLTDSDTCAAPAVSVDVSDFVPGGSVAVTVTCSVGTRGLEPLATPDLHVGATAVATVDRYRAAGPAP